MCGQRVTNEEAVLSEGGGRVGREGRRGTEFRCECGVPVLMCLEPRPKSTLSYACTAFIDVSKNCAHVTEGRNLAL